MQLRKIPNQISWDLRKYFPNHLEERAIISYLPLKQNW